MDASNYDEARFTQVKADVGNLLKMVGTNPASVKFIPISAFEGDNITKISDKMPWYKGKTLFALLDELEVPEKPTDKPLRIPIQDAYSISGIGTVPVGRVETGILKKGMNVVFMPANKGGECKSIEMSYNFV